MLPAILATLGAGYLARSAAKWWHERESARQLPLGEHGIIRGAEPIHLRGDPARGVLLLHGYGDTPQTLSYLANHLYASGWTVRAPLLPGHGRTLREFADSSADDWIAFAEIEYAAMRARHDTVALVGLSMGGALATIVAANAPELPALALIAPYLEMPPGLIRIARLHRVWGPVVPYVHGRGDASIHDAAERERNLAYGTSTARLVHELCRVVERGKAASSRVRAPTLVVQSREDNRIPPDAAERIFASVGAAEKRLEWVEGCGHIITVDFGRERVFELVDRWLAGHTGAARRAAAV
jgi:carboxylesterase